MTKSELMFDYILENGYATEEEVKLVTYINGFNEEALNDILQVRTGLSYEQLIEEDEETEEDEEEEQKISILTTKK